MAKLNLKDYNTKTPTIAPEDLEEDVAILTIDKVNEVNVEDEDAVGGTRKALVMSFNEIEDRSMWPNRTAIATLIAKLGDDTDEWMGQQVPVEKVRVTYKGRTYDKVQVVPAGQWDEYLKPKSAKGKKR